MPEPRTLFLSIAAGVGAFALLLLIISVGTTTWLDDGYGNTIGLFRKCYGSNTTIITDNSSNGPGCYAENRVTQGGLSVFGILLLSFGVIALIASIFIQQPIVLWSSLILYYFASMFVMSAYATWGVYSRDSYSYFFPAYPPVTSTDIRHTGLGASYNLCVAAHYFLWTALTVLAFAAGYAYNADRNTNG
jgi:hypothetical protein